MARTIFIGDIHGCRRELDELLQLLELGRADRLVFLGDIVDRGPDSLGALDRVRRLVAEGAQCVRGNHEQRYAKQFLRTAEKRRDLREDRQELFESMTCERLEFLSNLPNYIEFPDIGVLAVHGGICPRSAARTSGRICQYFTLSATYNSPVTGPTML